MPQATTVPEGAAKVDVVDSTSLNVTNSKKKRTLSTPYHFSSGPQTSEDYDDLQPYYAFFIAQLADANLLNVPHRRLGTGGSSSALLREYNGERLTMTVQGLFGCTSIVLISRRGVYMNHSRFSQIASSMPLDISGSC